MNARPRHQGWQQARRDDAGPVDRGSAKMRHSHLRPLPREHLQRQLGAAFAARVGIHARIIDIDGLGTFRNDPTARRRPFVDGDGGQMNDTTQ